MKGAKIGSLGFFAAASVDNCSSQKTKKIPF